MKEKIVKSGWPVTDELKLRRMIEELLTGFGKKLEKYGNVLDREVYRV